jgi:D-alanyl-D-alanine carboxypeptidase
VPDSTARRPRTFTLHVATLLVVGLATLGCGIPADGGFDSDSGDVEHSGPLDTGRVTVNRLDPDLLDAIQAAARDARDDGVRMVVTSGWRSKAHQRRLFDEAVTRYGSAEEALRYVSPPDRSEHVTGDAVDIGPTDAADWLGRHGADYGLCQIFANEIWHYELATTPGGRCPEMYADSSSRHA